MLSMIKFSTGKKKKRRVKTAINPIIDIEK